jgi:hypothetical protein
MVRPVIKRNCSFALSVLVLGFGAPVVAQQQPSYVTVAKAYLNATTVARISVRGQDKPPKSLRLADPTTARLAITADTFAVFKAPAVVPARFSYLWTGATIAPGKAPNFKKQNLFGFFSSFVAPVGDKAAGAFTLQIGPQDAQLAATPETEALVRLIGQQSATVSIQSLQLTGEVQASTTEADAPFVRFSQFLFPTRSGDVLALTVRTPASGKADSVVSESDVMGSGVSVQRNTLMWYHLVCGMPASVPAQALEQSQDAQEQTNLVTDYAVLKSLLGPCV